MAKVERQSRIIGPVPDGTTAEVNRHVLQPLRAHGESLVLRALPPRGSEPSFGRPGGGLNVGRICDASGVGAHL